MTTDQHSALTECATRLGVPYEYRITAKACAISIDGASTFTATFSVACRSLVLAHQRRVRDLRTRRVLRDLNSSDCATPDCIHTDDAVGCIYNDDILAEFEVAP